MEISRQITITKFYKDKTIVDTYKPSHEVLMLIEEIIENEKKIYSYTVYNEKNK